MHLTQFQTREPIDRLAAQADKMVEHASILKGAGLAVVADNLVEQSEKLRGVIVMLHSMRAYQPSLDLRKVDNV